MCISLLGGAKVRFRQGARRPKFRQVGSMLAHFSLLSAAWAHFSLLDAFVAPFGRLFRDLGRSSLDFGAPSWPYVGTFFALGGIFRRGAGIAAKKPCWHFLSVFRFHNEARRYVRSTWNPSKNDAGKRLVKKTQETVKRNPPASDISEPVLVRNRKREFC